MSHRRCRTQGRGGGTDRERRPTIATEVPDSVGTGSPPRGATPPARAGSAGPFAARRYLALLWFWTKRDFDARYRRSALQALWAILQPFFFVAVFVFVFGVIFKASGGDIPYLSYMLSGVIVLRIVSSAMSSNTCLSDNYNVISHSYFPREVIPLSQVLGATLDLGVTSVALVIVAMVQHVPIHSTILWAPLVLVSALALASAACVVVSTIQVFVRDLQFAMTFIVQGLFFASPITYRPDQLPHGLRWLNHVNPVSVDVEALRSVALRGQLPNWPLFGTHLALSIALLIAAVAHLRAVEHRIVDLA